MNYNSQEHIHKFESMVADTWDLHIGSVWAQLLRSHPLGQISIVVEIGPGFSDKIGLGLAAQRFQGTLFVVEPNDAARRWVTGRYRELLDRAEIVPVDQPVPSAGHLLPDRVDGLLMNHVLDDMVLHAALAPDERAGVYGLLWSDRENVAPTFRGTWQRLLADPSTQHAVGRQILDDLARLVEETSPRIFGVSQYSSWFLNNNGLELVDRIGARLLGELSGRIGRTSEMDRTILRRAGQDPDRWLFVDRYSSETEMG